MTKHHVLFPGLRRAQGALTSLLLTLLLSSGWPMAQNPDRPATGVEIGETRQRLQAHITFIENRRKAMNALHAYGAAERTLKQLFQQQGITESLGYTDSWGNNGVWLAWEQALVFYRYHSNVLSESSNSLPKSGFVSSADLNYFDDGMRGWKEHEQQLEKHMQELVSLYLRQAFNFDKQFALQRRYSELRAEAARRNDSKQIDALRIQEAERLKPLKLESDQLSEARGALRTTIEQHARKRFFEVVKFRTSDASTAARTTNRPNVTERTREPLVLTGKALGANEGDKP